MYYFGSIIMSKYTIESLHEYCQQQQLRLAQEDFTKITNKTMIHVYCALPDCQNIVSRPIYRLFEKLPLCKSCTMKQAKSSKYSLSMLIDYCREHNVVLSKDYSNMKLVCDTMIDATCMMNGCDEPVTKRLDIFLQNGPWCHTCSYKQRAIKREETNMDRYGVKNPMQNKKVQMKTQQTNQIRYGGNAPACSTHVVDKMKNTMLNTYDVDNAMKKTEFKDKQRESVLDHYGVDNPSKNLSIREKASDRLEKDTGYRHPLQDPDTLKKAQDTCERESRGAPSSTE